MIRAVFFSLIEDFLRGLSGPVGVRLRRGYYRRRLKKCGARLTIEPGVHIVRPDWICLGSDVWLDRYTVIIAGPPDPDAVVRVRENLDVRVSPGNIVIGDHCHIGIGTIIQGHGGVEIGSFFTSSPHVKIYSFSNDHRKRNLGTMRREGAPQNYLLTPVWIGSNVWIGMNAVVIGHSIGADCFIKPASVVTTSAPENSIIEGAPASVAGERYGVFEAQSQS